MPTLTQTNTTGNEGQVKPPRRPRGAGSLFKRQRSPYWWIQYHRNGKTYRESTGTTKEPKARRILQRRLYEAASEFFIAPQTARIKVSELAADFLRDQKICERKAAADAKTRWELHLKPFFGHLRALQVGTELISRYIAKRQEEGAANATINREMASLKRMFNLGAQASPPKVHRVPKFQKLIERNVRTGFVEDSHYGKLADACSAVGVWMRALFETAYNYGWRIGELQNLKVRKIDLLSGTIRLNNGETKNDDGRLVVMTASVRQLLTECLAGKGPEDNVFTRAGKPVRDFRGAWIKACEQAGMPGLLFHDLRRTAVRNMVRSGIPEVVAMRISGHKTRAVFDRYNIVSERDLKEAARRLEDRLKTLDGDNGERLDFIAVRQDAPHEGRPI
jgi:integrase